MADQEEPDGADQPDRDIDSLLLSDDPLVRREGYRLTFVRYMLLLYNYLRATYWYCLSEADTADVCGHTFLGFIEKVENKRFYPTGKLLPLLIGIAENQVMRLLQGRSRRKESQGAFLEEPYRHELRPEKRLVIRETIRDAIVGKGVLQGYERLVFTKWHELVINNGGFVPTHEDLRNSIFGPPTKAVFGTSLADEDTDYLEALTESVKRTLYRALEKLRDYLDRRG